MAKNGEKAKRENQRHGARRWQNGGRQRKPKISISEMIA